MRVSNFMVRVNCNRHMGRSRSSFSATLSLSLGKAPRWNPCLQNLDLSHLGSVITFLHPEKWIRLENGCWNVKFRHYVNQNGATSILVTTRSQAFFSQFYKHILVLCFIISVAYGLTHINKFLLFIFLVCVLPF